MQYVWMILAILGMVGVDQLTKLWVLENIPLHTVIPGIPGLFSLTYVQNTGAAWSSFQGMIWLFCLIFVVFTGFLVWELVTKKMGFSTFERWCLVAVYGGGLGNMIDRVRLGFVVDMVYLDFMEFPIFNVADCFITCGCIALIVHLVCFNRNFWKEEKK